MKEKLKKHLLIKWWIPVLLFISSVLSFLSSLAFTNSIINSILIFLLITTCGILLIAGIWQLIKGKWYWGLLQLGILFISIFGVIYAIAFMSMFGPDTDTFADDLKLPENIELDYPIDLPFDKKRPDNYKNKTIEDKTFQLYNSFQPGLFEYDLWIRSDKSGIVYLKAFEITQNIELSKSRLRNSSKIRIQNTNGEIKKFGTKNHFTIYEGDWGKPYGTRFEIWFKSSNGGNEVKLLEKNYVTEGWMR